MRRVLPFSGIRPDLIGGFFVLIGHFTGLSGAAMVSLTPPGATRVLLVPQAGEQAGNPGRGDPRERCLQEGTSAELTAQRRLCEESRI